MSAFGKVILTWAAFGMVGVFGSVNAAPGQFAVEEATIDGIHKAMKAGKLTAHRLVETYLKRIDAYDKNGPAINAVIMVNPRALQEADSLDAKFRRSGFVGPLHGIPVFLKDAITTNDMPTTGGSLSLQGFTPATEAPIVRKLRQAGAIILGKTNLDEFTFGTQGISSLGGQTLNPYDLTRSPAGSSGGSAAAVASNFVAVSLGTDTGSSIRFPASVNSLVGVRGTVGLVSRNGIMPNSNTQDMGGPLTRTVADAARVLDAIAGYDPGDPATAWSIGKIPKTYTSFLDPKGLKGARIGVLKSFFGQEPESQEVNVAIEKSIEVMRKQGAIIVPIDEPVDINKVNDIQVSFHETTAYFNQYLKEVGAPVKSLEEILASGKYAKAIEGGIKNRLKISMADLEYKERMLKRMQLQERVMKIMADHSLDAMVYPLNKSLVAKIGETQAKHNGYFAAITGFPTVEVPAGFSKPTDSAPLGVPIGFEILGRPWSESTLIKLAYAFEQATKYRRPPASVPPLKF